MNKWSLKTRFGLAAACLSVCALVVGLLIIRPVVYRHQLAEVDRSLEDNAGELWKDMAEKKDATGKGPSPRRPLPESFIPAVLRGRYVQLHGLDGLLLYRSPNLGKIELSGEPGVLSTVVIKDRNCRVGTFDWGDFRVHIGIRLGSLEETQQDLLQALLWIAPALGCVVFAAGWLLGRQSLTPVSRLSMAAEKIDAANPGERLPLPTARDELHRLTEVLNHSFDRLQAAYSSAARFSADASHQLKTPLAVLRAGLDHLRIHPSLPAEARSEVEALLKQTRRLTTLTEDLLLLAQIDAGRLRLDTTTFDVSAHCLAVLDDLEVLASARGIAVESDIAPDVTAAGDARRLAVILQNLTENAVKYAGENGRVRLTCHHAENLVRISVANTGPAIPAELRDRLFERFYRAGAGENISGHGLGLNIARGLARAMSGDLTLHRSTGEWTEFLLTLPATGA
jgi:signal transduction histidine kinase